MTENKQKYKYKVVNRDRDELIITLITRSRRYLLFGKRITEERTFRGSLGCWGEVPNGWEVAQHNNETLNQIWRQWYWTDKYPIEGGGR